MARRALDVREAAQGGDDDVLEAMLEKRSCTGSRPGGSGVRPRWSAWATRVVRVGGGSLRYYKSAMHVEAQGSAFLWDITAAAPVAGSDAGVGGRLALEVATKDGKAYQFAAPDERSLARWLGLLRAVVLLNAGTPRAVSAGSGAPAAVAALSATALAEDSDAD